VFAGLLKARILDEVLLGLRQPSEAEIVVKASEAAKYMLLLLNDGRF
jgi:TetR/AcrR family transcriptional repressor of mexJK operon